MNEVKYEHVSKEINLYTMSVIFTCLRMLMFNASCATCHFLLDLVMHERIAPEVALVVSFAVTGVGSTTVLPQGWSASR